MKTLEVTFCETTVRYDGQLVSLGKQRKELVNEDDFLLWKMTKVLAFESEGVKLHISGIKVTYPYLPGCV